MNGTAWNWLTHYYYLSLYHFKFDSKSAINQIDNIKCDCHRFDLKSNDHALCAFLYNGRELDRENARENVLLK